VISGHDFAPGQLSGRPLRSRPVYQLSTPQQFPCPVSASVSRPVGTARSLTAGPQYASHKEQARAVRFVPRSAPKGHSLGRSAIASERQLTGIRAEPEAAQGKGFACQPHLLPADFLLFRSVSVSLVLFCLGRLPHLYFLSFRQPLPVPSTVSKGQSALRVPHVTQA